MIRTFKEHDIRKVQELSGKLWDFKVSAGEHSGTPYRLLVPGCWESLAEFSKYRGKAVYTTEFQGKGNVRLVFKGVSHTANVSVNGNFVKTHYNAFTPFDAIVQNLSDGTHKLEVEVDNTFSEASSLHIPNDYMTYGGITRGVEVQQLEDIYIKKIFFTPVKKGNDWFAQVKVKNVNLSGEEKEVEVSFALDNTLYRFKKQRVGAGAELVLEEEFQFPNVKEWMMETPNLYLVHAKLSVDGKEVDDLIERIGFRTIKLDGRKILINGKQIRIKGFNRHEDHPHFGCAIPYESMIYDLYFVKDLGANSIRTSHYPNDEIFLDLCDENGILIWEENHARGLEEKDMVNPNFKKQCADCIEEMIFEHYNHPSIFIWGILNECASETEYGRECYKEQFEQIESLDSSRPTTFASNKHYKDLCFSYPTVISNNFYPLWYFETPVEEMMGKLMKYADEQCNEVKKPYIVSEIGSGAIYGCHSHTRDKWTEEFQYDNLKRQVEPILENEECTGVYVWQFTDVRVSTEWAMQRPRTHNNKGVLDEYRREKMGYYAIKEVFARYGNYFE
ncbi:MAG: glycoside hydrolase family 2 TIM barrel-domain containing protein [Bacillota bacterium]